jgi:sugar lactone lactonase YvrE
MQKSYLYAAGGLLAAAALAAGLVVLSQHRRPSSGSQAEAQGLYKPRAMAFGPDGGLYIVDSRNNRIEKRNVTGALEKRFGKLGVKDGELREPCGIAVAKDGFIYVADSFFTLDPNGGLPWGRIQKFSPGGLFAGGWGKVSVAPNDLFGPRAIALDSKNHVYVSDTGNHRIIKYDSNGSFIKAWGKNGSGSGDFKEPFGLAFDSKDQCYVVDRLNFRVQVFDQNGKYLREFKVNSGDKEQVNREPYIAIDSQRGWAWISDPTGGKILRHSLSGAFQKSYDSSVADGKLKQPTGLAVREADGMLFVSDGELAKIVMVKP